MTDYEGGGMPKDLPTGETSAVNKTILDKKNQVVSNKGSRNQRQHM